MIEQLKLINMTLNNIGAILCIIVMLIVFMFYAMLIKK